MKYDRRALTKIPHLCQERSSVEPLSDAPFGVRNSEEHLTLLRLSFGNLASRVMMNYNGRQKQTEQLQVV